MLETSRSVESLRASGFLCAASSGTGFDCNQADRVSWSTGHAEALSAGAAAEPGAAAVLVNGHMRLWGAC